MPALAAILLLAALQSSDEAADWPTWRFDPGRTGASPRALPAELSLRWVRTLPPQAPAYRHPRLQFDLGYEPVVSGKTLFLGSAANDSVVALDTETGRENWKFYAGGPVRFAPAAWRDRVFVASDDGCLYALDAASGKALWAFRAVPSLRKAIGNGRLISVWPVRGGPAVADGRVYFAAGVWPSEGVFVYALDARTGDVVWLNDRTGSLYGDQPHAAEAIGGLAPQGYLVVNGDDLVVPCGSALPATFDRKTGALKEFSLPKAGRLPGGWLAVVDPEKGKDVRRGKVVLDRDATRDRHEDRVREGPGVPGLGSRIAVGGRTFVFADGFPGVEGTIHTMLAADGKLFVVTREGRLYAFGARPGPAETHAPEPLPLPRPAAAPPAPKLPWTRGYAAVWGIGDGTWLDRVLAQTELRIVAIDSDREKVGALRERLDRAGLYGARASAQVGDPADHGLPPYFASVILCPDPVAVGFGRRADFVERLFACLRPFGGAAVLALQADRRGEFEARAGALPGARVRHEGEWTYLSREGPLPGTTNYLGGWQASPDDLVRAPLGVLWFDDALGHFKRSPQPVFLDGIMISRPKAWRTTHPSDRPYKLLPAVYTDVYTGRVLEKNDPLLAGMALPPAENVEPQPEQYRPPGQKDAWKPEPPQPGHRLNPLTGAKEARSFPKSYGCDGGVDYGHLYTMRSGTPAFYDKRLESGTIHVGGPRSGCTNSLIPANGLLNAPYFYEGCTCSYPLPVGLALVALPAVHEQWSTWGPGEAGEIRRVGINFGAPGDRMTEAGTLWLDHPAVGGPSPSVAIATVPKEPTYYYRHSVWVEGGRGWPWVAASGVKGLRTLTLSNLRKDVAYHVRLTFADPEFGEVGRRVFAVALQGETKVRRFDPAGEGGGRMAAIVKEFSGIRTDGVLTVDLAPERDEPILSGIEVVAEGLPLDPIPALEKPRRPVLFRP